jgi:hypothetical protein
MVPGKRIKMKPVSLKENCRLKEHAVIAFNFNGVQPVSLQAPIVPFVQLFKELGAAASC